jgi:hypothetical protein
MKYLACGKTVNWAAAWPRAPVLFYDAAGQKIPDVLIVLRFVYAEDVIEAAVLADYHDQMLDRRRCVDRFLPLRAACRDGAGAECDDESAEQRPALPRASCDRRHAEYTSHGSLLQLWSSQT